MARPHAERLDRLADIIVHIGVGLQPGQDLIVAAPLDAVPLVRRITAQAYRAGSPLVSVMLHDAVNELARFEHAPEASFDRVAQWQFDARARALRENTASLLIAGDDPALLAGQDSERIGRMNRARAVAAEGVQQETNALRVNWCIAAAATPDWAKAVFPALAADQALAQLWEAIFAVTRADEPDPVEAWRSHVAQLHARAAALTARSFAALHFRAPGTDLVVGLADRHVWKGGAVTAANGARCVPNMPTEEVFTMPHRDRVDGVVRSTKPLSFGGSLIQDIVMRFEHGRAVDVTARCGQEVLRRVMQTDEGACRLGEVALVPDESPISRCGVLFQNTLFDENAASHIAIGRCLKMTSQDGLTLDAASLAARGGNDSLIHIDWMIGSARMDVDGITAGGTAEAVMRQGAWVAPAA
jgi:aminopeptidase